MNGQALATLQRLSAAADAISVNLVDLERDPTHHMLQTATLHGETSRRWTEAQVDLAHLFEWNARLTERVDRARELVGGRTKLPAATEATLDAMLCGPSIQLSSTEIPLGERNLLGGAQSDEFCTPDELLTLMSRAFDRAQSMFAAVARVWNDLLPRLATLRRQLSESEACASDLGPAVRDQLAGVEQRVASFADIVVADPLSADRSELDHVAGDVDRFAADVERAGRMRRESNDRLVAARSLLDQIRDAVRRCSESRRYASARIDHPALPAPLHFDESLVAELEHVEEQMAVGDWIAAESEVTEWRVRATELLQQAQANLRATRAPIDARDELRGRLEGFRAKADILGALEDATLTALYTQARDALYTAPTDLAAAADLLGCYQAAITDLSARREVPR
jgi:hypothetical protein